LSKYFCKNVAEKMNCRYFLPTKYILLRKDKTDPKGKLIFKAIKLETIPEKANGFITFFRSIN